MANTRIWNGYESLPVRYRVIKNSEVIKVGDWIGDAATGADNIDGTTEPVLGFALDIVNVDKVSVQSPSIDTGALGGTWTSSTKSYTAAADNVTVDFVKVKYIPVKEDRQFVATLDADKGTTTGSNLEGYYLSILTSDSSLLDESTSTGTKSGMQFQVVDPYNQGPDTEVIVRVLQRETDLA